MDFSLRGMSFEEARDARDGRTQKLFRELNERIAELQRSRMFIEFACECADRDCAAPIVLSIDEYEEARRSPSTFVVAPAHVVAALERVVAQTERFAIVESRALAAAAAPASPRLVDS